MSVQIHIVMGTTGAYSDREEWPVAAYFDKERATKHADLAMVEAHKIRQKTPAYTSPKDQNPYDPSMRIDYPGTDYYTISVDLLDAIPGIDG